jgi:hypothetical protein
MEQSYLIQRLSAPRVGGLGVRNPFSFGAGGGRLSNEALDLLAPVLNFEYMGAAEYEFGAIPEGLNKIHQHASKGNLSFGTVDVKLKEIKFDKYGYDGWTERSAETMPVYVIGATPDLEEIKRRVYLMATDEDRCLADMRKHKLHEGLYLRDATTLNRQLKFEPKYDRPAVGWLELNNGFFFSIDPIMTERFAALFGLHIEIKTANQ